jgi:hypothetical protein
MVTYCTFLSSFYTVCIFYILITIFTVCTVVDIVHSDKSHLTVFTTVLLHILISPPPIFYNLYFTHSDKNHIYSFYCSGYYLLW